MKKVHTIHAKYVEKIEKFVRNFFDSLESHFFAGLMYKYNKN